MNQRSKIMASGVIAVALLLVPVLVAARSTDQTSSDRISLRSSSFAKKLPALRTNSDSTLYIITCDGPIEEAWKSELEEAGVELGAYLPDFSFVSKITDKALVKKIKRLPFVSNVKIFDPAYKLAPELEKELKKGEECKVVVRAFDHEKNLSGLVKRLVKNRETDSENREGVSTLTVDEDLLTTLATSDDVVWIEPYPEITVFNDRAREIVHSDVLQRTGFTGKGQIVGVTDTGLDTGDIHNLHPDLAGQVLQIIPSDFRPNPSDTSDRNGHGTHVAATVLGTGKASNGKLAGMAPDAKLVFHAGGINDSSGLSFLNSYDTWSEAYRYGAKINSVSWGSMTNATYNYLAWEADRFLWDHKDAILLVAAGNSGFEGLGTVSSPATAKNVVAVGATTTNRFEEHFKDSVASFSGKGPTLDGRLKPDVVAPGVTILSARSSLAKDDIFSPPFENSKYGYLSGTSMATPVVAGGVAQIRQFLNENGYSNPSGALMKAMLVTGTDQVTYKAWHRPNDLFETYVQGYGQVNLQKAIRTDFIDETKGLQTGDSVSYHLTVTETDKPVIVTLAWTDYPSEPLAFKNLVNDLDLSITSPTGEKFYGNYGNNMENRFNNEADHKNNVEQIFIPNAEKGTYTVTVKAYNIPQGPQPYAIATNQTLRLEGEQPDKIVKLTANQKKVEIQENEDIQLSLTATQQNGKKVDVTNKATWKSLKASVVSVEKGKISAKMKGQTSVQATYGGKSIKIQVIVK